MKRRGARFDQFVVYTFTMNEGEKKVLKSDEVNRGLTDFGPHTLYPISVFTKGRFYSIRPGRDRWYSTVGEGGEYFVDCDTLVGHALVSLEDGSEYHCIIPLGDPVFWHRYVRSVPKGHGITLFPGEYMYIAEGSVVGYPEKMIHNSEIVFTRHYTMAEDSIVAVMFREDNGSEVSA